MIQADTTIAIPGFAATGFEWLQYIIRAFMIPFGVYLVKRLDKQDEKLGGLITKVAEINTTLVGQDGENGLRSRFKEVERLITELRIAFSRQLGVEVRTKDRTDA